MKAILEYLRWYASTWRCHHEEDTGTLVECGMRKVWHCRHCGKFMDII